MARAWRCYLASGLPLAIVYLWLPADTAKMWEWPLIGWSSVIAIVVGIAVNRPDARRAWYFLAAGVATFIVGDNMYTFRSVVLHSEALFPSYVDLLYLAMYPLLITGLAMLVHRRTAGRDRAGVIDAAVITASVGLVSWIRLIAPYVRIEHLGLLERLASIAYPVGDVALLAIAVRLAVGGGRRPTAFWLLTGSLVPLLVSDALYGYFNLAGTWHEHNPVDVGWIIFYMGWGAAALHPSMRTLSTATASTRRINPTRLVLIGSAVLVPPASLAIEDWSGAINDATAIAVASAILFILVLVRIAGLARDAADQRGAARLGALVSNASDAIVIVNARGHVQYRTPSTDIMLGITGAELDDRRFRELLEDGDAERLIVVLASSSATATFEWRIRRGDGEWRDLEVIAADMRSSADIGGVVLTMRDITDRKQMDHELRRQALHDSLTGLPNRTLFVDRVDQALERASRVDGTVAVLFMGIDDFKEVNGRVGRTAGDEVLIALSARLTEAMPSGVTVARLGGDEFAMLLESRDELEPLRAAALIKEALTEPFDVSRGHVMVHVSIGVATGSQQTHSAADLLRDADLATYVAKRNGKDRIEQYLPAMHEEASRRLEIADELRLAIGADELVVFYQPIVDIQSGRAVGVEALVRWQHPTRGLLLPNDFIPIAEATGLVVPLGRWVLNDACRMVGRWKRSNIVDDRFYVSVNLSGRHVQDDQVEADVGTVLSSSGLPAEALVLEVTETSLIQDLAPVGSTLANLKSLGLRIAVDDFGTGYSSLAYLSNFPLDIIKIDKSFVDRVANTVDGETIVRAVVDLAHTLGLKAIAEGVETAEQAHALEHLGCRLAQGFLYARPMPADQTAAYLTDQSSSRRGDVLELAQFASEPVLLGQGRGFSEQG